MFIVVEVCCVSRGIVFRIFCYWYCFLVDFIMLFIVGFIGEVFDIFMGKLIVFVYFEEMVFDECKGFGMFIGCYILICVIWFLLFCMLLFVKLVIFFGIFFCCFWWGLLRLFVDWVKVLDCIYWKFIDKKLVVIILKDDIFINNWKKVM